MTRRTTRRRCVPDGDVSCETKVFGLQNLVRAGVVQDCLGMNTGLVRKSAVASDGVHEWYVDLYCLCDEVFDLTQHGQVVLGLDVLGVGSVQACHKTAERCDADTLADAKDS